MSRNVLGEKLEVIDKLQYLSNCIDKKCEVLSATNDHETVLKQLLTLCVRTRKNCEVFEEILLRGETSVDSSPIKSTNLVITLHLLDIIGEENCRNLKKDDIQKFKAELEIFTKNYLLQTRDPVFLNLYQLFCSDTRAGNVDSTENQDILRSTNGLSEISSIFDTSTDLITVEISSQDKEVSDPTNEKNNKENPHASNISNEISTNNDVPTTNVENELLPSSNSTLGNLEAQKLAETAGSSTSLVEPNDSEKSTGNSQNELQPTTERPKESEDDNNVETVAGSSQQADILPDSTSASSSNEICQEGEKPVEISQNDSLQSPEKPLEIEDINQSEIVTEHIEENDANTANPSKDSQQITIENKSDSHENDSENPEKIDNLLDKEEAGPSQLTDENVLKNINNHSTDKDNKEYEPEKCSASSVDSSSVDKSNDAQKDIDILIDPENVEKDITTHSTEDQLAKCSVDSSADDKSKDPENVEDGNEAALPSKHTEKSVDDETNIEDPLIDLERSISPEDSLKLIIDEELNISDIKPTDLVEEIQEANTHSNDAEAIDLERTISPVDSLNLIIDEELNISDIKPSDLVEEIQEANTHSNDAEALSTEHLHSSECAPNLEKTSALNIPESQESSGKLHSSTDSTEKPSTEHSETVENGNINATVEEEPSTSQSTIVSRNCNDLDDNTFGNSSSDQTDKNSGNQQVFLTQLGLSKIANYEKIRTIRDELLEILSEENCREDKNGVMREDRDILEDDSSDSSDDEEKYTDDKVEAALKELDEDSLSDFGMNLDTELDSLSVDDILLNEISDTDSIDETDSQKQSENVEEKFILKKCSVILERRNLEKMQQELQSRPDMLQSVSKPASKGCYVVVELMKICQQIEKTGDEDSESSSNKSEDEQYDKKSVDEDAEIDRLCQMPTFGRKRRLSEEKNTQRKIKRKRRSINLSGTETSDLSGYSSVSEDEIKKKRISDYDTDENDDVPLDPNTLLTEIVCHTIHDSDSDTSTSSSDEEEKERTKRRKLDQNKTDEEATEVKKEKESSWKDDPLLKGNLNISKENEQKEKDVSKRRYEFSKSDEEIIESKKSKTKNRGKYLDPDYSESSSTDSSGDEFEDSFKRLKEGKIKNDSDVELVNSTNSNVINLDSEEEREDDNHTRKKIKKVLSSKNLTEETQKAAEEEKSRIKKLEEQKQLRCSQESQSQSQEDALVLDVSKDGTSIAVDPNLSKKLFSHQVEGVRFMWESCYLSVDSLKTFQGTGCILAHNMGLGKTFQVVTLVHTLFNHSFTNTKHVLIVCPLSTVSGWKREFQNGLKLAQKGKDIKITTLNNTHDRATKGFMINRWRRDGGVFIIGYDAFSRLTKNDNTILTNEIRQALVNPGPDLVVCDEAHVLKNGQSMRTKALMEIKTRRRIALTGTPLQNNLKEYYFMVQFVKPNLLGNKQEFNRQFVNPIMNGQYEDSLEHDITLMKKRTHVLHRLLKNTVQRYEATELHRYLQNMQDYAIFIQLHPLQEKLYKTYIEKKRIIEKDKNIKSFFSDYQILKYICSHPQLLHTMETQNAQRNRNIVQEKEVISQEPEVFDFEGVPQDWWKSHCPDDIKTKLEFGTKLQVMMAIIEEAEKIGEKVLIFTSSLVELSSVEYFLKLIGTPKCPSWKPKRDYFRMDGTVPPSIRTEMCDRFNDESSVTLRVFLMSHKVGGLGLNLTAANRVILLGANFNPSLDSQSIYRAYRFGQNKVVYIYRLLSMGTMEEKIYNRCVTKLAIASRVVDKHQITRHYKNLDLEDLYNIEIDLSLQRPAPSKPDDPVLSSILLKYECVHKFHHHQKLLENRPDEDLNEEDQRKAWEEFEAMNEREKNPPNPATSKIPELVENQWNQLHRHPAPMLPITQLMKQAFCSKNSPTQGAPRAMNQPKDATIQIRSNAIPPSVLKTLPRIPWLSDVGKELNVHSTEGVVGQTTGGTTNQSNSGSIHNAKSVSTTSSVSSTVVTQTRTVPATATQKSIPHDVRSAKVQKTYSAPGTIISVQSKTGTTNNKQGKPVNFSVLNKTTDSAVSQTRTSVHPTVVTNSISRDPRHLNVHSTNGAASEPLNLSCNQSRAGTINNNPGTSASSSVSNRPTDGASVLKRTGVPPTVIPNSISHPSPRLNIRSFNAAGWPTIGATVPPKISTTNKAKTISDESRKALLNATAQILQNGEQADKSKSVKKKSSAIGPNPLVLARLQHRKENLAGGSTKAPWRTSSSDDFQRPGSSNVGTTKKVKAKMFQVPANDVICIDISEDTNPSVQEQIDKLRNRNCTITKTTVPKRKNEDPPIIDIT